MKIKAFLAASIIVALIAMTAIASVKCDSTSDSDANRIIIVKIEGLQTKSDLSEVTLHATLYGNGLNYSGDATLDTALMGQELDLASRVNVPSSIDEFRFEVMLTTSNLTVLSASGSMSTTGQGAAYNALYLDPAYLNSTENSALTFNSVGILGSMDVRLTPSSSQETEYTVDLTWNTAKMSLTSTNPTFIFANVTSNTPEIPFTISVFEADKQVLYASGELEVSAENIAMPIPINSWDNNLISAWNVTFLCSNFAVQSRLSLSFFTNSSKISSESNTYRGQFEKITSPTSTPETEATSNNPSNNASVIDSITKTISTPTFLALLVALGVIVGLVVLVKLKK